MATFKLELSDYVNSEGEQQLRIRITVGKKMKRIATGIKLNKKHWNDQSNEIRKSHPDYHQVIAELKKQVLDLEKAHLDHVTKRKYISAEGLKNAVDPGRYSGNSFFGYYEKKIKLLPSPASRKNQTSILKKLKDYRGGEDLLFEDITPDFLSRYKLYLEKDLGNNPNTTHFNIVKIKTAYEEAVSDGVFEYEKTSPFRRIKTKKVKSSRAKLSMNDIKSLEDLNLPKGHLNHSRNLFLFSFFLQGIRAADLLQLRWKDVQEDRLMYTANKTKKGRSRIIMPQALKILDEYKAFQIKPGDYIFPYLKKYNRKDYDEDGWLKVVDSKVSQVRNNLQKVAEMIGVPKLSLHVARHTFADIARRKTGNVYLVSDALDHGDLKTTENYFSSAQNEENDSFVRSVFED